MMLVTRSDLRVSGLGTVLGQQAVEVMFNRGLKVMTAIATSDFSARILRKLEFQEKSSLALSEYRPGGELVYQCSPTHTHVRLFTKSSTTTTTTTQLFQSNIS